MWSHPCLLRCQNLGLLFSIPFCLSPWSAWDPRHPPAGVDVGPVLAGWGELRGNGGKVLSCSHIKHLPSSCIPPSPTCPCRPGDTLVAEAGTCRPTSLSLYTDRCLGNKAKTWKRWEAVLSPLCPVLLLPLGLCPWLSPGSFLPSLQPVPLVPGLVREGGMVPCPIRCLSC